MDAPKPQLTVSGALAQSLSEYKALFHVVMVLAAAMTLLAFATHAQQETGDSFQAICYLALALLFCSCLGFSLVMNTAHYTHLAACAAVLFGGAICALLVLYGLFGPDAQEIAKGEMLYEVAWVMTAFVGAYIYLPPAMAVRYALAVNGLLSVAALLFAIQHWSPSTQQAVGFIAGQLLFVNNMVIAMLSLFGMVQKRSTELMDESISSMERARKQAYALRYQDPETGCLNSAGINSELNQSMEIAAAQQYYVLTVILQLKNDDELQQRMGQEDYKNLLSKIAQELHSALPGGTALGRQEGSRFVVWFSGPDEAALKSYTEKLQLQLPSIGPANNNNSWAVGGMSGRGMRDAEFLLDQALFELHQARRASKNTARFGKIGVHQT